MEGEQQYYRRAPTDGYDGYVEHGHADEARGLEPVGEVAGDDGPRYSAHVKERREVG